MHSPIEHLLSELSHEINSPLAAIRNVLYLVSRRTDDQEIHRYLAIADAEAVSIAATLRRALNEQGGAKRNARSHSKAA